MSRSVLKQFKRVLTIRNALSCGFTPTEINNLPVLERQEYLSKIPKMKNLSFWITVNSIVLVIPFVLGIIGFWAILNYFRKC